MIGIYVHAKSAIRACRPRRNDRAMLVFGLRRLFKPYRLHTSISA